MLFTKSDQEIQSTGSSDSLKNMVENKNTLEKEVGKELELKLFCKYHKIPMEVEFEKFAHKGSHFVCASCKRYCSLNIRYI